MINSVCSPVQNGNGLDLVAETARTINFVATTGHPPHPHHMRLVIYKFFSLDRVIAISRGIYQPTGGLLLDEPRSTSSCYSVIVWLWVVLKRAEVIFRVKLSVDNIIY